MSVQSVEGDVLEVREEDDDLLRAAEELGIDLSAGLRRQQAEAGELAQVGVDSSALRDVIGAGTEPDEEGDGEPVADDDSAAAAQDLLAAAAALASDVDLAADGGELTGLDDILDLDAADLEPDDADSDED
jgi:DNA-directed RNA polymerase subunit beta